jgi:hypothetical protein
MGEKLIVALFKGVVYGDNKPIEAKIEIAKVGEDDKLGPYHSNGASGKYLLMLKPGYIYKLKISADGFDPLEEEIDLETLNGYLERTKDYNIYSKPFVASKPNEVIAQTEKVYKPSDEEVTFFNPGRPTKVKEEPKVETPAPTETLAVAVKEEPKKEEPKIETKKTETLVAVTKSEPIKVETKKEEAVAVKEEIKKAEIKKAEVIALAAKEEAKQAELKKAEIKKAEALAIAAKAEAKKEEIKKAEAIAVAAKEEAKKEEIKKAEAIAVKEQAKKVETSVKSSPAPCNNQLADLSSIKGKSLNDPAVYKQMMALVGNFCNDGVEFKVQIGAYRKPQNYKYQNLKNLGKVETQGFPDGITRFTQNQFKTIKEAEAHRQKAIAKGQKDSWIVVYSKGVRFTLEEFINIDFQAKGLN